MVPSMTMGVKPRRGAGGPETGSATDAGSSSAGPNRPGRSWGIACVSPPSGRPGAPARGGSPVIRNARVGSSASGLCRRGGSGWVISSPDGGASTPRDAPRPPSGRRIGWVAAGSAAIGKARVAVSSAGASAGRRRGKGWLPRPNRVGGAARSPGRPPLGAGSRAGLGSKKERRGAAWGPPLPLPGAGPSTSPGRVAAGQPTPGSAWSVVGPAVANGVNRDGRPVRGNAPLPGAGRGGSVGCR